jgi:hypothetical protein
MFYPLNLKTNFTKEQLFFKCRKISDCKYVFAQRQVFAYISIG